MDRAQGGGSQHEVPAALGILLEIYLFQPHPERLDQQPWGWGSGLCPSRPPRGLDDSPSLTPRIDFTALISHQLFEGEVSSVYDSRTETWRGLQLPGVTQQSSRSGERFGVRDPRRARWPGSRRRGTAARQQAEILSTGGYTHFSSWTEGVSLQGGWWLCQKHNRNLGLA